MKLPFGRRINWMDGVRNWIWIDFFSRSFWYVFIWRRWKLPFLYRSLDTTLPGALYGNNGKMIFGKYCGD